MLCWKPAAHRCLFHLLCTDMALTDKAKITDCKKIFLFCKDKLLLCGKNKDAPQLPAAAVFAQFIDKKIVNEWFYDSDYGYTAARTEKELQDSKDFSFFYLPLRSIFALEYPFARLAARSLALLNWKDSTRFCSACAGVLENAEDETALVCSACGKRLYPALSPAIIVQVYKGEKLLLAKHRERNTDIYTCLAGYVEPGENLEECVQREVREETGIEISDIRYVASQSWPFPNQFMVGFRARWKSGDICIQKSEIADARWFDKDNLPSIPKAGSLAYRLISGK